MSNKTLAQASLVTPPAATKIARTLSKHKDKRVDNYFWMNQRKDKNVIDYLNAENKYTDQVLKPTQALQKKLTAEFRARIKEDESTAPYKRGDYYYFTQFQIGKEYPLYSRQYKSVKNRVEVMLDVNELAVDHKYYQIGGISVSSEQNTIAYSVDTVGRRFFDIYFKNLMTGKTLPHTIRDTVGSIVWLNDNKSILYVKQDPITLRSHQVFKYTMGGQAELVYEEKDPQFYVSIAKSLTLKELYIYSISNSATEVQISSAEAHNLKFSILYKREPKHEYTVYDGGDRYFVLTNYKAKNFRLVEVKKSDPSRNKWQDIVPHKNDILIEDVLVLKNYIVLQERSNGLTRLTYFKRGQKKRSTLKFPDPTYMTDLGSNAEYEAETFRYEYQSLTRPESIYDFDFKKNNSELVQVEEVPTYIINHYNSERVWAKSHDGVKVPVSLVYKKSLFKKGQNPLFVYSYGSYGLSTDTYFRSNIISLLDRGFVFAIPHIRGGSEMGRKWYEDGKLLKKKNTFFDFIFSTEALLKKGFGKHGHVYAMGGSAGGLLMGAVINMRPDLFKGVVAAVPFVDVVTTMLDDTIPLTTNEYQEWGNPNEKKYYKYMKSYSPYDNVKKQKCPNILITSGFHDSQVQYWEPAKWAAKLRDNNIGDHLVLLKMDMTSGHSGTTGRFESLKEVALEYAFLLMLEDKGKK